MNRIRNWKTLLSSALLALVMTASVVTPAAAIYKDGYALWTDVIPLSGGGYLNVQHEVFINASYDYIGGGQIHIYGSALRICMKSAQVLYNTGGFYSWMQRGWYIWSDSAGDIDSDTLAGSTEGFWPACGSSTDWYHLATIESHHWPWAGTRVKIRSAYCVTSSGDGAGCAGYRTTYTAYLYSS